MRLSCQLSTWKEPLSLPRGRRSPLEAPRISNLFPLRKCRGDRQTKKSLLSSVPRIPQINSVAARIAQSDRSVETARIFVVELSELMCSRRSACRAWFWITPTRSLVRRVVIRMKHMVLMELGRVAARWTGYVATRRNSDLTQVAVKRLYAKHTVSV